MGMSLEDWLKDANVRWHRMVDPKPIREPRRRFWDEPEGTKQFHGTFLRDSAASRIQMRDLRSGAQPSRSQRIVDFVDVFMDDVRVSGFGHIFSEREEDNPDGDSFNFF